MEVESGRRLSRAGVLLRILGFGAFFAVCLYWISRYGLEWVDELSAGYFFVAMVFLPVIGAPISLFYLAAGGLFAPGIAILCGALALVGNTSLGYGIGRWALGEVAREKLLKRWPSVVSPSRLNGVRAIILIRAVPGVPFWIQNIGLGAARLPFLPYLALSVSIQSTFMIATVLSVSGLLERNHAYLLWGLAALIVAILLSRYFLRWARTEPSAESD